MFLVIVFIANGRMQHAERWVMGAKYRRNRWIKERCQEHA